MAYDGWLDPWLPALKAHTAGSPVLEIGCGGGEDTAVLVAAGIEVMAFDLSAADVEAARQAIPQARLWCQDIRAPLPPEAHHLAAIVASLSLHYFPWDDTLAIVAGLRTRLRPGGLLLARFNSTEDIHFGAHGHPRLDDHYYLVDGQPKRFFDRAALETLFAEGWRWCFCEHCLTGKYGRPKALWEIALERDDSA